MKSFKAIAKLVMFEVTSITIFIAITLYAYQH